MNEKKENLYVLRIQLISLDADSENLDKIREEYYEKYTGNLTEALLSFMIQMETRENPSFVDGFTKTVGDTMFHQLSELRKELSNTLPVAMEEKELSQLIFHGAVNGLMSFMKGSRQSRMDWFTKPDITRLLKMSGE